jgi:hypothetical protein
MILPVPSKKIKHLNNPQNHIDFPRILKRLSLGEIGGWACAEKPLAGIICLPRYFPLIIRTVPD